MKYIWKNCIYTFFKKNFKYLIIYYTFLCLYLLSTYIINGTININTLICCLGLNYDKNDSIINILMFLISFGFHLLITLQILDNKFSNNILSRMSILKWFFIKVFSIIIIQASLYLPFLIFITSTPKLIKYLLMSYIFYIFIELIFFYILIFGKKFKYIITLTIIIFILLGFIPIKAQLIEKNIFLIITAIISLLILCYILINYNFINIIELEENNENRS